MAFMSSFPEFGLISKEEYLVDNAREMVDWKKRPRAPDIFTIVVPKRHVGRPRVVRALPEALLDDNQPDCDEIEVSGKRRRTVGGVDTCQNKQAYTNWITKELWPDLEKGLKLMSYKGRATAQYLKKRYRMASGPRRYSGLNESTIKGWMMLDGKTFKSNVLEAIRVVECGLLSDNIMHMGAKGLWEGRKPLLTEFFLLLQSLRNANIGLNSLLIQMQLRAFVQVKCLEILLEFGAKHQISRPYVRHFVRTKMGWSFQCTTTDASTLPANWVAQGVAVTHRIAYLVHAYRIPECLLVNGDQTGMRVMPVGAERTYTQQGARDVKVTGRNDRRQVTLLMACSTAGDLLPVQMIFKGKKPIVLPRGQASKELRAIGWHLTMTYNHWSQLESMQEWIEIIYLPYVAKKCEELDLDGRVQKSVLLLDCYNVHNL
ncbi:unnamed protein product [Calypogeia fissa]